MEQSNRLASVDEAVRSLVHDKNLRALKIDGPWGTGKTYFIQDFAARENELLKKHGLTFAYVSLFGLNSVDELRSRLSVSRLIHPKMQGAVNKLKLPKTVLGWDIESIGEIGSEMIKDRSLRNLFVCIDDLERRGGDLEIPEIFGFISELTEQRESKCVVLLNSGALADDRNILTNYVEKIFDLEIAFRPTPADVMQIGIRDSNDARLALPIFERAQYANIRVMRRLEWVLEIISSTASNLRTSPIWPKIVAQSATITILHYRDLAKFGGSLESLAKWSSTGYLVRKSLSQGSNRPAYSDDAKEILLKLEYGTEPFDTAIIGLLHSGSLDRQLLRDGVSEATQASIAAQRHEDLASIWDKYNDNFRVGGKQFADDIEKFLVESAVHLSRADALDAINFLLRVRNTEKTRSLARKALKPIVEQIPPSHREAAFKNYDAVWQSGLVAKIPSKFSSTERPSVAHIFNELTSKPNSWNPALFLEFLKFDSGEITRFLLETDQRGLLGQLREFYERLPTAPENVGEQAEKLMNAALEQVSKKDKLNRIRVDSYLGEIRMNRFATEAKIRAERSDSTKSD